MAHPNVLAGAPWYRGSDVAAIQGPDRWDFDELRARVSRRSKELGSQGLVTGQVVLVPDAPALDLLVMQHALANLGCGLFPFSSRCPEGQEQALAATAGVEWRWRGGVTRKPRLEPTGFGGGLPNRESVKPALVVETSGGAGSPKAVMLTAENVISSASLVNEWLGLGKGGCWLSCLPRSHVGGLMIGYRCALAGATILLHERFDAVAVVRDLELHRVTHLSLVPPMLAQLLELTNGPPGCLRVLLVGGQALSGVLASRAIEAGWPLRVTYGMTETASQIATSEELREIPHPGVVGPPLPGIGVFCDGNPTAPGPFKIRGRVVMSGYANPGRLPGLGLENGWLVTKDIGYLTDTGKLVILGREDDVLVIGGEAVIPLRVEEEIMSVPGVDGVVVLAFENPVWGKRLVAAFTGDIGRDGLERWCKEHLPSRSRPRSFHRVSQFPLLSSGKVDRERVREMVTEPEEADLQALAAGRAG